MTRRLVQALLCSALLFCAIAGAAEDRRTLLALYDSREPGVERPDSNFIHLLLEKPLNHLGLVVEYRDVNARPLPDASRYRGVITWFTDGEMPDPEGYCRWLTAALNDGTKALIIGDFGAYADLQGRDTNGLIVRQALSALGVAPDYDVESTENPFVIRTKDVLKEHLQWETDTPPSATIYHCFRPAMKNVRVWRSIERTDVPRSESVAICTTPRGGFVMYPALMFREFKRPEYQTEWDVNPFVFLQEVFDCAEMLRPDVTTAFGLRAAFSHIDGDGMANMTQDIGSRPEPSGRVIYREILAKLPLPVTVGLVVGRVDPKSLGSEAFVQLGSDILALRNVQPGCHGWAHAMIWSKGTVGLQFTPYAFSSAKETTEAMTYIEKELMGGKKKVEVYLWTGDCRPQETSLREVEEFGVEQMNGGDPRFDAHFNSVSNICALTRSVGKYRQIYAASQNEMLYTSLWTQNYGGFQHVIETFERSGSPRRLLPVNVYYHFYSGERTAALEALKKVYKWCLDRSLCWIHAVEYTRGVRGFLSARTGRASENSYWIEDYGRLLTVRTDVCAKHVDMRASKNVVGYTHDLNALFVALAPAERAEIVLCEKETDTPCVRRSTSALRNVLSGEKTWQAEARLYAPGALQLRGYRPGQALSVSVMEKTEKIAADKGGFLSVPLPSGRGEWVEVSIAP